MDCRQFVPLSDVCYEVPQETVKPSCPKVIFCAPKIESKQCTSDTKSKVSPCIGVFLLSIVTLIVFICYGYCYRNSEFQKNMIRPSWYPSQRVLLLGWTIFFLLIAVQVCSTKSPYNGIFGIILILVFLYGILFYQQSSMKYSSWIAVLIFVFLCLWITILPGTGVLVLPLLWSFFIVVLTCNLASNN